MELMKQTGLDDEMLERLVHRFYERVQQDPLLAPIFATRIVDWAPHLAKMVSFWSSVALMTGRYHGAPVPAHVALPLSDVHFERWLAHFRETASEICPPAGAAHVIDRAERIARSLQMAIEQSQAGPDAIPALRS